MSIITLPSRSLLKPDRAWDLPRPAGNRHRSPWWRKLLGGRDGQTRLQPGSCCGCGSPTQSCGTCAFPETLYLTDSAGTVTLTWADNLSGWTGCQTITPSNAVTDCQCFDGYTTAGTCTMLVNYRLTYTNPSCQVIRQWYFCTGAGPAPAYCCDGGYDLSTCLHPGNTCSDGLKHPCQFSAQDIGNLTNCTLPESVTLTLGAADGLVSPFASGDVVLQS